MPPVAGGTENRIHVRALCQEFANVGIHRTIRAPVVRVGHGLDRFTTRLADVADRHELDILFSQHPVQVAGAAPANSDSAYDDPLAGTDRPIETQRTRGDDGGHGQHRTRLRRGTDEIPPADHRRGERIRYP